jgi:hypothetical protein
MQCLMDLSNGTQLCAIGANLKSSLFPLVGNFLPRVPAPGIILHYRISHSQNYSVCCLLCLTYFVLHNLCHTLCFHV